MNGKGKLWHQLFLLFFFWGGSLLPSSPGSFIDWIKVAFSTENKKGGQRSVKQFHCVTWNKEEIDKRKKRGGAMTSYTSIYSVSWSRKGRACAYILRALLLLSPLNRCWFVTLSTCHIATRVSTPHCLLPSFSKSQKRNSSFSLFH